MGRYQALLSHPAWGFLMKKGTVSLASFFRKSASSAHPKAAAVAQSALDLACEVQRLQSACEGKSSPLNVAPGKAQVETTETQQQAQQCSHVTKSAFMGWMLDNLPNRNAFGKSHSVKISSHLNRTAWETKVKSFLSTLGTATPFPLFPPFLLFVICLTRFFFQRRTPRTANRRAN